ncbi:MAG TPA: ribonuclease III [Thermohalobaculum sp.]|nr:ribonuclease III [Thermohalobaculum sp.]
MADPRADGTLNQLRSVLGHTFAVPELLERAVTHPSASSAARPDNQRLEFLGDRVLGLIIAEALLKTYPDEAEGALAPRLNALVRRETLAEVAREIRLGEALRLGRSEATGGGRRKTAILADAMEAVIAALYLDGGMAAARGFVLSRWQARLEAPDTAPMDAKTRLQEWVQARGQETPEYVVVNREGPDHAPRFTVVARLADGTEAEGAAKSKKQAEQAAAGALLARLGIAEAGND